MQTTILIGSLMNDADIRDFIVQIDGIIPDELCTAILAEYQNSTTWEQTHIGSGLDTRVRNCNVLQISHQQVINGDSARQRLDDEMFSCAAKAIEGYRNRFPLCRIESDSGYELLRYRIGEYYTEHTDSFKQVPRAVSCSFALNDDYEGGEWGFFGREVVLRPKRGSALLFPSNFMYPHEIMPVTKGTRYSIVTWFI